MAPVHTMEECQRTALRHREHYRALTFAFMEFINKVDFDPFWIRDLTERLHHETNAPYLNGLREAGIDIKDYIEYTPPKIQEQLLIMPLDNQLAVQTLFILIKDSCDLMKTTFLKSLPVIKTKGQFRRLVYRLRASFRAPAFITGVELHDNPDSYDHVVAFCDLVYHLLSRDLDSF